MDTVETFRVRYARTSDEDLLAIIAVDPQSLTPEARQALAEEVRRRELKGPGVDTLLATISYNPWVDSPSTERMVKYPKAPFGSRLLAYIVDGFVGAAVFIGALAFGAFNDWLTGGGGFVFGMIILAAFVWALYYSFAKDGREGGQSIGKGMVDLMVVNVKTNKPCSTGESALRALILILLNIVPLVGIFIEPVVAIAADDGRRLGDRAADTQVIRTSDYRKGSPI